MHVVATAGHVDHGKSTLVTALTGADPDRLAEEKARGLTIDLGFASMTLPSGRQVGFVDVPGHVRFLRNMLAGVGSVDACLFVVAASEGWMPQSEEHLRILELLGVRAGVVALTKVARLDSDWVALARMEVGEALAGSFLERSEVIEVDAPGGRGLGELTGALERLLAITPSALDWGRPRLWVDRSFPVTGAGTVVTGTLVGGSLGVGDEVVLVRRAASRAGTVRIRGLQSHGRHLERAAPGCRLALNLAGVHHGAVVRGDAVVLASQWEPTAVFDATLQVLSSLRHEVSPRGAYKAYLGSGEHAARLRILGKGPIQPGGSGSVRVRLSVKVPLMPGDRYVLRESGRVETVGGGEVLDVAPVLPASTARPDRRVERVISERGWVEADLLERLTGERRAPDLAGRWCVDPLVRRRADEELRGAVEAAGRSGLDLAGLDERRRALAEQHPGLVLRNGRATLAGAPSSLERLAGHPFLAALEAAPFSPPGDDGVDPTELREMARLGLIVECEGIWFASSALQHATQVVACLLSEQPGGVTAAQVKQALGTTRRWLMPLLARLDATGVTRRRGDFRVAGPCLPGPGAPQRQKVEVAPAPDPEH